MVKKLYRYTAAAAAVLFLSAAAFAPGLFLAGCDFIGASVFPSYLMSADAMVDFGNHVPSGASFRDNYQLWMKNVTTHSGRNYLVLCIDFWQDDVYADTFLIYDGNLKFLQKVDRYDAYGPASPPYRTTRFVAPGPDPAIERILVGFEGTFELVVIDPSGSTPEIKPDPGLIGPYGYTLLNDSFAIPGVSGTWFMRSDFYSSTYTYNSLTATYTAGSSGSGSIFAGGLINTSGAFYGATVRPDTQVTLFFHGNESGSGYAITVPTPASLPATLFTADATLLTNWPYLSYDSIFSTRDGVVFAEWGNDWRIYRTGGGVTSGPPEQDREDLAWTFSPDGGAYYIADGRESRLIKSRTWW